MIIQYEDCISQFEFYDDIHVIWKFLKSNYLRLNSENSSIFSYEFWSTCGRVSKNISLTTNSLQRWHRSLNYNFQNAHTNLNTLLNAVHIEHNISLIKILQSLYKQMPDKVINCELTNILKNKDNYQGVELLITLDARIKIRSFSIFFIYKFIFNFNIHLRQKIFMNLFSNNFINIFCLR
ncbi:hypothetical protein DMUE_3850 [Dictyocoela muelleri]|nr:hypothetical protein DMUE_3850 [Dictyocoela muelleri]